MKITAYNRHHNVDLSGGVAVTSITYASTHTSLGSNTPLADSGAGTPGSGPQAAAWDHVHPASGSSSFGSNSTRVSSTSAAGASSSNSRADHVHDGIGGATASSSNTLNRGNLNLRAGTGIALALSNTDGGSGFDTVTIQNIASGSSGGGSVSYGSNSTRVASVPAAGASSLVSRADHVHDGITSIAKAGSSALYGAVTLTGGTNVTLTQSGQDISIAASGGGGATIKYAPNKAATLNATYGDDFAASSLDAKWAAHSTSGSFTTSHVQTQEHDGSWLSMMFHAQNGRIYEPAPDTDFDASCCMMGQWRIMGGGSVSSQGKVGIALLDSSMNGVGVIVYNDGTAYLMEITAGVLGANSALASGFGGTNQIGNSPVWLRITRVKSTNTYTGYISFSGRDWSEGSATPTRVKSITQSRLAIGSFNDGGNLLTGRLLFEYVDGF